MSHPIVELAKLSIETYVKEKKNIQPPTYLPPEMEGKAGVFVSLKKGGQLRGCIGTFLPTTDNIAAEVIRNAVESAAADPRFPPVTEDELPELEISVDVLTAPEKISSKDELDAKKYGIIVAAGSRKGLLLPDLQGVNTPEDQIAICRRKGGIGEKEAVELYRFEVRRYK
ncbi:MAG: AmmeMemoRadiSam system protein A [Candidatus Margulisiibacteriota bacterium]